MLLDFSPQEIWNLGLICTLLKVVCLEELKAPWWLDAGGFLDGAFVGGAGGIWRTGSGSMWKTLNKKTPHWDSVCQYVRTAVIRHDVISEDGMGQLAPKQLKRLHVENLGD